MHIESSLPLLYYFLVWSAATCFDPSPAFPVPAWPNGVEDLKPAFKTIQKKLENLIPAEIYDTASFSVEITSTTESLVAYHHTARKRNETRPGVERVDGDSLYRIASISKVFTVLGLLYQHEGGNLSLDDPINTYIPELSGEIPWRDITLRSLASQLSGITRDWAQGDLLNGLPDPTTVGLPPPTENDRASLPKCDEYNNYISACNETSLIESLKGSKPLFAPNQESTYSNIAFELIGLALSRATNMSYEAYMQAAIFGPLSMSLTTLFTPPNDSHAVLPIGENYWGVEEGIQNPTGGIYSSSSDMSKFIRYILTHYNAIATGVNWFLPASFATGIGSFYGMPFELFRTDKLLEESRRPVTVVTKSGGLPGYTSRIFMMPEYGLGLTILVACAPDCGNLLGALQEIITVPLIRTAEEAIWKDVNDTHTGVYSAVDPNLNSTLTLTSSPSTGLTTTSFISNGTDILNTVVPEMFVDNTRPWRLQLVPTLLFKNEEKKQGEIWRMIPAYESVEGENRGVWDEFCTTDIDVGIYAGLPLNEVVFWHEEGEVELPAWRVKMKASKHQKDSPHLVVQR